MTERYQPLARRHRPARFTGPGGLVDQPHIATALRNSVRSGRVAQAYLLSGPRGTGKTTAARLLAMALNCEAPDDGEPCGVCDSCSRIRGGAGTLDVIEMDAASNRGVDDARELRDKLVYAASQPGRWKVYILDEAHMLTREAWNTLLKALEEPPPHVVFAFCTTEPEKIEQTAQPVLSRCQHFPFRRISADSIAEHLRHVAQDEGLAVLESPAPGQQGVTQEALRLIARRADGGMRDALSLLDQLHAFSGEEAITVNTVRTALGEAPEDAYTQFLEDLAARDRAALFTALQDMSAQGVDMVRFFDGVRDCLSAYAMLRSKVRPHGWSESAMKRMWSLRGAMSEEQLAACIDLAQEDEQGVRKSTRPHLAFTAFVSRAATEMDRLAPDTPARAASEEREEPRARSAARSR